MKNVKRMSSHDLNEDHFDCLSKQELLQVNGGSSFWNGFFAGEGAQEIDRKSYGHDGWYTFGYGLGLTLKQNVE